MLYQIKNFVSFTVVVHYLMNKVHNFVNFSLWCEACVFSDISKQCNRHGHGICQTVLANAACKVGTVKGALKLILKFYVLK